MLWRVLLLRLHFQCISHYSSQDVVFFSDGHPSVIYYFFCSYNSACFLLFVCLPHIVTNGGVREAAPLSTSFPYLTSFPSYHVKIDFGLLHYCKSIGCSSSLMVSQSSLLPQRYSHSSVQTLHCTCIQSSLNDCTCVYYPFTQVQTLTFSPTMFHTVVSFTGGRGQDCWSSQTHHANAPPLPFLAGEGCQRGSGSG